MKILMGMKTLKNIFSGKMNRFAATKILFFGMMTPVYSNADLGHTIDDLYKRGSLVVSNAKSWALNCKEGSEFSSELSEKAAAQNLSSSSKAEPFAESETVESIQKFIIPKLLFIRNQPNLESRLASIDLSETGELRSTKSLIDLIQRLRGQVEAKALNQDQLQTINESLTSILNYLIQFNKVLSENLLKNRASSELAQAFQSIKHEMNDSDTKEDISNYISYAYKGFDAWYYIHDGQFFREYLTDTNYYCGYLAGISKIEKLLAH